MSFLGGNSFKPGSRQSEDRRERERDSEPAYPGESTRILTKLPEEEAVDYAAEAPAFATKATPTPPDKCTNVIANGSKWQGTLKVDDSVRVDGTFSGEIQAKGTIHVAEGAQVDAKVRAAFVVIGGHFRGEIRCEHRVDLLPRSRVNGDVISKVLNVHEGAVLDGRVQMSAEGELGSATSPRLNRSNRSEREEAHREETTNGVHAGTIIE